MPINSYDNYPLTWRPDKQKSTKIEASLLSIVDSTIRTRYFKE